MKLLDKGLFIIILLLITIQSYAQLDAELVKVRWDNELISLKLKLTNKSLVSQTIEIPTALDLFYCINNHPILTVKKEGLVFEIKSDFKLGYHGYVGTYPRNAPKDYKIKSNNKIRNLTFKPRRKKAIKLYIITRDYIFENKGNISFEVIYYDPKTKERVFSFNFIGSR